MKYFTPEISVCGNLLNQSTITLECETAYLKFWLKVRGPFNYDT